MPPLAQFIQDFEQALLSLDRLKAKTLLMQLDRSNPSSRAVEEVITAVMEKLGAEWDQGRIALSQLYMGGRICQEVIETMFPLDESRIESQPNIAIVSLHDYHLLGKRIVYSVLRASRLEVLDYGQMEVEALVTRVNEDRIRVLLISTLMLPSALRIKEVSAQLKASNLGVKIVVGGAPFRFDDQLWKEVGADAMGRNASEAVGIIHTLFGEEA